MRMRTTRLVTRLFAAALVASLAALLARPARGTDPATRCAPLEAIESSAASTAPPYTPCSAATAKPTADTSCPGRDDVAVVLDHDFATAAEDGKGKSTSWRRFLQDLQGLPELRCRNGEIDPIRIAPSACATIQERRFGSCQQGGRFFPASVAGAGNTTPAEEAFRWVAERVLVAPPAGRGKSVVLFGFDGVPDGDYGRNPPAVAFSDAVAGAVRNGLAVEAVASPRSYRYVYVIAQHDFRAYAASVADRIAAAWNREAPAFHVSLSEDGFASPGGRRDAAAVSVSNVYMGAPWSSGSLPLLGREGRGGSAGLPVYRIETASWAQSQSHEWTAFRLQWNANQSLWARLAPAGVRVGPPELHLNHELPQAIPSDSAWASAPGVTVVQFPSDSCPARRAVGVGELFFQSVLASPGRVDLWLFRGADDVSSVVDWSRKYAKPGTPPPAASIRGQTPAADPALVPRTSKFVSSLRSSVGSGLVSAAVVAPTPSLDPCLVELHGLVRNAHLWGAGDPGPRAFEELGSRAECGAWAPLVAEIAATKPRAFDPLTRIPQQPKDARVGIEVFVTSILSAARANLVRWSDDPAAQACVLGTFRVTLEPTQRPDPNVWKPVRPR